MLAEIRVLDSYNPNIKPLPKGHWIKLSGGYGLASKAWICKCSECDDTLWVYVDTDREWKYCPSCGAKMSEDEEV